MSTRRDAAYLLGAATLVCLLVAGSVHPYIAPLCLVWLVIQRALLDRSGVRLPEAALAILHIWLALVFIFFTLLGDRESGGGADMLELLLGFLKNPKFRIRPVIKCITEQLLPLADKMEWGYKLPYMITGQLNAHPRSAIKMRGGDNPNDFLGFYDAMIEDE